MSLEYILRFDGACWPNPDGRASYGYTIVHKGTQIAEGHGVAGDGKGMSNNFAEFYALYKGLEKFMSLRCLEYKANLNILGDSQLVVKMLNKKKAHDPSKSPKMMTKLYYPAFVKALNVLNKIKDKDFVVNLQWVPRSQNTVADDLSKKDQIEVCPYEGLTKQEKKLKFGNNSLDKRFADVIALDKS